MEDESGSVIMLSALIFFGFFLLVALFWFGWKMTQRSHSVSPYTGVPLRRLTEISYYSTEKILRYLHDLKEYDNRIFKLSSAAFCRDTGRIFQDCISIFDVININWTFLQKRYPGNYVSWGSLSREFQESILQKHTSVEGFQTGHSSPTPAPRLIEPEYVYTKPGPLYVDPVTYVLLGWKIVPGTEFEVLIVQKPVN